MWQFKNNKEYYPLGAFAVVDTANAPWPAVINQVLFLFSAPLPQACSLDCRSCVHMKEGLWEVFKGLAKPTLNSF